MEQTAKQKYISSIDRIIEGNTEYYLKDYNGNRDVLMQHGSDDDAGVLFMCWAYEDEKDVWSSSDVVAIWKIKTN